jgi:hypothetical protein
MWVRTRSFDMDERMDKVVALAQEQDQAIQDLNEVIERVKAGLIGDATQDESTGGDQ